MNDVQSIRAPNGLSQPSVEVREGGGGRMRLVGVSEGVVAGEKLAAEDVRLTRR